MKNIYFLHQNTSVSGKTKQRTQLMQLVVASFFTVQNFLVVADSREVMIKNYPLC